MGKIKNWIFVLMLVCSVLQPSCKKRTEDKHIYIVKPGELRGPALPYTNPSCVTSENMTSSNCINLDSINLVSTPSFYHNWYIFHCVTANKDTLTLLFSNIQEQDCSYKVVSSDGNWQSFCEFPSFGYNEFTVIGNMNKTNGPKIGINTNSGQAVVKFDSPNSATVYACLYATCYPFPGNPFSKVYTLNFQVTLNNFKR